MPETPQNNAPLNNVDHLSREDAYKHGVREVNPDEPVVFVDPDKIRTRPLGPPGKSIGNSNTAAASSFRGQMEGQVEGSTDALMEKLKNHTEKTNKDQKPSPVPTLSEFAKHTKKSGPAALDDLEINGKEHGIAIVPSYKIDTKEEVINQFTSGTEDAEETPVYDDATREKILENMPGTDQDWMRLIGNHEGGHLKTEGPNGTRLKVLIEENKADKIAYNAARERGQGDLALAMIDLRALASQNDSTHSSAGINANDKVTEVHYHVAWSYREKTNEFVDDNFDWDSYEGQATTPQELLKENPDAYFATAQKNLDDLQAKAMKDYNEDPSIDNQRAVYEAQIQIDYAQSYQDAYRRRVMGQDIPLREPTQLISQEQEESYVSNMGPHNEVLRQLNSIGIAASNNEEFSSKSLFENYDWSSRTDGAEDMYDLDREERNEITKNLLEEKVDDVIQNYKDNPSDETLTRLVALERALHENAYDIARLDAYKNNTDVPNLSDIEPILLISESEKEAFVINKIEENEIENAFITEHGETIQNHYSAIMDAHTPEAIFKTFDWDSYEGSATTPEEVKEENPEAYRIQEIAYIENKKENALSAYNSDPSYENTGKLVEALWLINDRYDAINIGRIEDGLSDTIPPLDHDPDIISKETLYDYFRERQIRLNDQNPDIAPPQENIAPPPEMDKGYTKGVDGTAYTAQVSSAIGGTPKVDFEEGISLRGMAMASFFNQNSSPDPEAVSLVNAQLPEENQSLTLSIDQTRTQSIYTPA